MQEPRTWSLDEWEASKDPNYNPSAQDQQPQVNPMPGTSVPGTEKTGLPGMPIAPYFGVDQSTWQMGPQNIKDEAPNQGFWSSINPVPGIWNDLKDYATQGPPLFRPGASIGVHGSPSFNPITDPLVRAGGQLQHGDAGGSLGTLAGGYGVPYLLGKGIGAARDVPYGQIAREAPAVAKDAISGGWEGAKAPSGISRWGITLPQSLATALTVGGAAKWFGAPKEISVPMGAMAGSYPVIRGALGKMRAGIAERGANRAFVEEQTGIAARAGETPYSGPKSNTGSRFTGSVVEPMKEPELPRGKDTPFGYKESKPFSPPVEETPAPAPEPELPPGRKSPFFERDMGPGKPTVGKYQPEKITYKKQGPSPKEELIGAARKLDMNKKSPHSRNPEDLARAMRRMKERQR